jgi:hypothetical protein
MEHLSRNVVSVEQLYEDIEEKNDEIKTLNAEVFMLSEALVNLIGREEKKKRENYRREGSYLDPYENQNLNELTREERLKQENESKSIVVQSLNKQREYKNRRLNELTIKHNELEKKKQSEEDEFRRAFDAEKDKINKEMDALISTQTNELDAIKHELGRHEELQKDMIAYEKEMEDLNQKKKKYDEKLKKINYDFMLKMAIENQKLQEEHEANFQEELFKDKEDAEKQIKKLGIEIHENNSQMNEKSSLQRYEIDKIKKQKEQIMKLNKSYKRDMMLNAETMEEYSKRQQNQNKKIKLLKSKIHILENSLSQIVQDFEKEKHLLKKQNEEIIGGQQNELEMLREEFKAKAKELKMLKSLSNVIIEQRSDIEQFFLEALEQIKEEIRKKIAEERKINKFRVPGESIGGTMGSMGHTTGGSQDQTKNYADKVDLNDLDWEDRERVLRLLFSKINAGVHPSQNWKSIEGEGEQSQALDDYE